MGKDDVVPFPFNELLYGHDEIEEIGFLYRLGEIFLINQRGTQGKVFRSYFRRRHFFEDFIDDFRSDFLAALDFNDVEAAACLNEQAKLTGLILFGLRLKVGGGRFHRCILQPQQRQQFMQVIQ